MINPQKIHPGMKPNKVNPRKTQSTRVIVATLKNTRVVALKRLIILIT
jgi:hypothetical protein